MVRNHRASLGSLLHCLTASWGKGGLYIQFFSLISTHAHCPSFCHRDPPRNASLCLPDNLVPGTGRLLLGPAKAMSSLGLSSPGPSSRSTCSSPQPSLLNTLQVTNVLLRPRSPKPATSYKTPDRCKRVTPATSGRCSCLSSPGCCQPALLPDTLHRPQAAATPQPGQWQGVIFTAGLRHAQGRRNLCLETKPLSPAFRKKNSDFKLREEGQKQRGRAVGSGPPPNHGREGGFKLSWSSPGLSTAAGVAAA